MNNSWRNVVIGDSKPLKEGKGDSPVAPAAKAASPSVDKRRYERLLVVYTPLVNSRVAAFLYDGAIFEGILDSFVTENEFALILRMATMMRAGREASGDSGFKIGTTFEWMNIRFDDMAELKSVNENKSSTGGIDTDAAISRRKGDFGKERELRPWVPEENGQQQNKLTLSNAEESTAWDQFATNERLFGLKTDFNEEIYTTRLDRNSEHIRTKEYAAEKLAREIMAAPTSNLHMAEERGHRPASEEAADEELLYGAVIRDSDQKSMPPGFSAEPEISAVAAAAVEADSKPSGSTLNPAALEFKLNVDAPEFKPPSSTKVTYYNQSRRNLYYGNQSYGQQPYHNYYQQPLAQQQSYMPYYPMAMPVYPTMVPYPAAAPETKAPDAAVPASESSEAAAKASAAMNPNAAAFFMPVATNPSPYYYSGPQATPYPYYAASPYYPTSNYSGYYYDPSTSNTENSSGNSDGSSTLNGQ